MKYKWFKYLLMANIVYPFFAVYSVFVIWGYWLQDVRIRFEIDSMLFFPRGAVTAALFGTLLNLSLLIPCSVVFGILQNKFIDSKYYRVSYFIAAVIGSFLGEVNNGGTFHSLFKWELGAIGCLVGILFCWHASKIWKEKAKGSATVF